MEIVDTAAAVIHHKNTDLWSIAPNAMVFTAIQLMADKNIGALLVMEQGRLVGLVSERDYTRNVVLKGKASKDTPVRDIMVKDVTTVTPAHTVEQCMTLMTDQRVRHLPVLDQGKVVGLISIGDLVRWTISAQKARIDQLGAYISGSYPG